MGCCNKEHSGEPISRARYWGGLLVLSGAQAGALVALYGLSVPFPRYRRVIPFFKAYAKDTIKSAIDKERITVAGEAPREEACEWAPEFDLAAASSGAPAAGAPEEASAAPPSFLDDAFAPGAWEPALQ